VADARRVRARFADSQCCEVSGVLDWDEVKDIALVKLEATARPLNRLCLTNPPVGARAYVIGAPKGFEFSLSDGLVSQVRVVDGFAQYQISCPISPGNSGGPVLNTGGEVLGVVSWSSKDAQNLNFATPAACLLTLKSESPVTAWTALPRQRRSRKSNQVALRERETLPAAAAGRDLAELRAALRRADGEEVTVTLNRSGGSCSYRVTLPKDFVK
jgi:serine protease Do